MYTSQSEIQTLLYISFSQCKSIGYLPTPICNTVSHSRKIDRWNKEKFRIERKNMLCLWFYYPAFPSNLQWASFILHCILDSKYIPCYTPVMARTKTKENKKEQETTLHIQLVQQMVNLSTSGFGLVAALAWNSVIQEFVNTYIKKWLPSGGGIISLLLYAVVVTIIAVLVTYNLSKTLKRLRSLHEGSQKKKDE